MKRVIVLMIAFAIVGTTVFASASSVQKQLDTQKSQLKNAQSALNENKSEQKDVLRQIETLDKNINTTELQIETTKNQITQLEKDIVIAEENIQYMQKEYEKKYDTRKERVATYYRNASVSIWDALDETTDPTERMYMERIINGVLDYDDNLIKEIKEEKKAIEEEKMRLEDDKVACNELKASLETKLAGLNDTVAVRTKYMAQLESDAKLLEKSIDEIQKKADELEAELKRIASSSATSKYMGGTMQWPLPGYYTITSPFGMRMHPTLHVRKMHTGVDISGSGVNGKNVVAAADGKVITAGWLGGYGYAVMIDHGGGVVTLYGHSSKLLVKVGDQVKAGQTIMKVGTTGNSTGPHLHFEVRIDGKYVDPLNGYIKAK